MPNPHIPKRGRPLRGERYTASTIFGGHAVVAKQDPYPAVLERLSALLDWGIHADNIGGSEPDILAEITNAAREVLTRRDPASLHLIPQPEAN